MADFIPTADANTLNAGSATKQHARGVILAYAGNTDTLNSQDTGPGLSVTYTVRVFLPNGYAEYAGWAPSQPRFDCMIYPCPIGTEVDVYSIADRIYFTCEERPAWKPCT